MKNKLPFLQMTYWSISTIHFLQAHGSLLVEIQPATLQPLRNMTKLSDVRWILISKGQRVQDIPFSVQNFWSLIFRKTSDSPGVKDDSEETFQSRQKKNILSFIILSVTSATAKVNAKRIRNRKKRDAIMRQTWWVTFKWQKHTLLKEKKGVRHSLLWNLVKAQYLPLLSKKKKKATEQWIH